MWSALLTKGDKSDNLLLIDIKINIVTVYFAIVNVLQKDEDKIYLPVLTKQTTHLIILINLTKETFPNAS